MTSAPFAISARVASAMRSGPRSSPSIASPNCGYTMKNARPGFGRMWPGDTRSSGPARDLPNEVPRADRLEVGVAKHARSRDARLQRAKRRGGRLDVRMRVDQPGQQVAALQVDSADARRRRRRAIGDRGDLAAAHADGDVGPRSCAGAVDERHVDQVDVLRDCEAAAEVEQTAR